MSTTRAVRFATVRGIEVRVAPSLALIAAAIVWLFTNRFRGDEGTLVAVVMAISLALLFFATILAHELAHALEARHRGVKVHGITLLLFGGVTEMHSHGRHPRDELVIAAVGPYVSLVCGAVFALIATFAPQVLPAGVASPVATVAGLLGWWNVLLAVFNLVPGAPLDGGRVLRAALWWLLDDRLRALRIAVRCGQAIGLALIGLGVVALVRVPLGRAGAGSLLEGAVGISLLVVLGLFLFVAARAELQDAELHALLADCTVAELLGASIPVGVGTATPDTPGGVGPTLPDDVPDDVPGAVHEGVPVVELSDDLHTLVARLHGEHRVVLLAQDGRVVGTLTEQDAARALARLRQQHHGGRR